VFKRDSSARRPGGFRVFRSTSTSGGDHTQKVKRRSETVDIFSALKGEDSHGTAPLGWDGYGL